MEPKQKQTLELIEQSNNSFTMIEGGVPVIPDLIINGSDLEQDDLKRIGINFMRSGCPTIQVLFNTDDTSGTKFVQDNWRRFLDLLSLPGETFEFHSIKGHVEDEYRPNMSMLITRSAE